MADDFDDFDDDIDDDELDPNPQGQNQQQQREDLRDMRRAARRGNQEKARADAAERKLAMVQAGIDISSPIGALFVEGYKGPTDLETLKAEAAKVPGLIVPATPAPTDEPPPPAEPTDQGDTDVRDTLHSGGMPPDNTPADPIKAAIDRGTETIEKGGDEEDGLVAGFRTLYEAGASGDDRALWSPEKHRQLAE